MTGAATESFYRRAAAVYDYMSFGPGTPLTLRQFLADEAHHVEDYLDSRTRIASNPVILDFGCGTGYYLHRILSGIVRPHVAEILGIEVATDMAEVARRRLNPFDNAQVITADITRFRRPMTPSEVPVGICTYNTIGVVEDVDAVAKAMCAQCEGGFLLVSCFRGEAFESVAESLYTDWEAYVGSRDKSRVDPVGRTFINTATGFRSRWLTQAELEGAFGHWSSAIVARGSADLRAYLEFDLR